MAPDRARRAWITSSPEATEALAAALGARLGPGAVVALDGELGAGKTCFVRGLAAGLGVEEGVGSPTYTLMQEHGGGRLPLYHFDAWMEGREKALFVEGGDEWLRADGVAVVEWAERVRSWLPRPLLAVRLAHRSPAERLVEVAVEGTGSGEPEGAEGLRTALEAVETPPDAVETRETAEAG